MKLTLLLLTTALTLASAAPSPSNAPIAESKPATEADIAAYLNPKSDAAVEKREYVELTYVCQNAPWFEPCKSFFGATNKCHNIDGAYNDKISSVGPSQGLFCMYYVDANCFGDKFGVGYPGVNNLNADVVLSRFNDKISSFSCNWR